MLRPQSIHRPTTVQSIHRYPPPAKWKLSTVHRECPQSKIFPLGGLSTGWIFFIGDTLQWMVENPISLGGLDGGLIWDSLGGKFKFVEVTLFLHFTTTFYTT